ncbi:hypothetical protein QQ045_022213 [Rhodiola kirilowii]
MVHLTAHLVRELRILGPVYMRLMYPFERYMKILKSYARNRHRPEGCIVEGYITEEAVEFCTNFLGNTTAIGIPRPRHFDRFQGKGTSGSKQIVKSVDELSKAHFYILQHIPEMTPFIDEHLNIVRSANREKNEIWVQREHRRSFCKWLKTNGALSNQGNSEEESDDDLVKWLMAGPRPSVYMWKSFDNSGFCFHTKDQDERSVAQNSGVTLVAETTHVSSARDRNQISTPLNYFGVIEEIWELDYVKLQVSVFKCKWVNHSVVRNDEFGMTFVDFCREGYKDEPFIMAEQARQVFYVKDPSDKNLFVVLHGKQQVTNDSTSGTTKDLAEDCIHVWIMAQCSSNGEEDFRVEQCTPAKKTKRGPSLMLDLIRRHRDAGTVVRTRVPIDYKDGRKVPSEVKDFMWNEATEVFVGPERYKEQEVKYASSAWRNFKSRLATDYIFGKKKDEDPTKEYQYIDSAQWKEFVEHRLSEDARKLSAQNKALAGKNKYAHIMGRGGYRKVKEVLINEKLADLIAQGVIEEGATPSITVERYEVWKRARLKKNKEFVTPRVRLVAENIDQLVEKSSQGSFSPHGRHDILTEAIGTLEYPGRTRGVGTHVPWKIGFPKSKSSRTTPSSSTSHVEMPDRLGCHCHVDVDPTTSIPEGGLKCVLFIEGVAEGDREQVAIGRVMNGQFINYQQIPSHTLKVKVEKTLVRSAILPVPHAKYNILIEAESNHVAWPNDLIVVGNREYDNLVCVYLPLTDDETIECVPLYCRLLNEVWTPLNREMFIVYVDQSVFGDDYGIAVNTIDLKELYKTAALGNFACELFIW